MRVVSVEQVRELERLTFAAGTSEDELQRRAGAAVADAALRLGGLPTNVVALVGPGNNGRDAYIAAGRLREASWPTTLFLTPRHSVSSTELSAFTEAGGRVVHQLEEGAPALDLLLRASGVVLDGLIGIGGRGALRGPLAEVALTCNATRGVNPRMLVISVDAPSGVDADTGAAEGAAVRADATVVLGAVKRGLLTPRALPYVGRLVFADIGLVDAFQEAPELITRERVRGVLPTPAADAHKGSFGRLLVVAGSERYVGAAYLVCAAAVRAGAGIVTLAAPRWLRDVVASRLAETTYLPLPDLGPVGAPQESAEIVFRELETFDALAIGPGLSSDGGAVECVEAILRRRAELGTPAIVDADALNALARLDGWPAWIGNGIVMTPHLGELRRLAPHLDSEVAPWDVAARLSSHWPGTLVIKGPFTSIAHGGRAAVHALPNPGLATGGTGDVLAGIVGGLLARGFEPERAAELAVWVHGQAGAGAAEGRDAGGVMASDLLTEIPATLADTLDDRPRVKLRSVSASGTSLSRATQ